MTLEGQSKLDRINGLSEVFILLARNDAKRYVAPFSINYSFQICEKVLKKVDIRENDEHDVRTVITDIQYRSKLYTFWIFLV